MDPSSCRRTVPVLSVVLAQLMDEGRYGGQSLVAIAGGEAVAHAIHGRLPTSTKGVDLED
jgi:hypothetical protein